VALFIGSCLTGVLDLLVIRVTGEFTCLIHSPDVASFRNQFVIFFFMGGLLMIWTRRFWLWMLWVDVSRLLQLIDLYGRDFSFFVIAI
jgi:hypothetical protein